MICSACGREVPDTARVCGYCGTRLQARAGAPEKATAETPPPPQQAIPEPRTKVVAPDTAATAPPPALPEVIPEPRVRTTVSDAAALQAQPVSREAVPEPGTRRHLGRWIALAAAILVVGGLAVATFVFDVFRIFGDGGAATTTIASQGSSALTARGLPAQVGSILTDPRVTYQADFSSTPPDWQYNPALVTFGEDGAAFRSDGTYARLQRAPSLTGRAALFGLRADSPILNVMLEQGEWLQPGFRRWGVILHFDDDTFDYEVVTDDQYEASAMVEGVESGEKYWILLGHAGGNLFTFLWPDGQWDARASHIEGLGEDWAPALRAIIENPGGTVYLEDYAELDFAAFSGW